MTRVMIQLSPRGKIIYQFLSLTVALLLLYGAGFLLSELGRLPAPPLAILPAAAIQAFMTRVFSLFCLTSFIAAGLMLAGEAASARDAGRAFRAWRALVVLAAVFSPFEFGQALDSIMALALMAILLWSARLDAASSFLRLWQSSLLLIAVSLPANHFAQGAALAALVAFQRQVAYALGALCIAFWLMPRYSALGRDWAEVRLPFAALLLCLGGGLISLGRLTLPPPIGLGAAALIIVCYLIIASHLARSLRDRHENASLAPHWIALAALGWLTGAGLLGALLVQGGVGGALAGTDGSAAQDWLADWTLVAVVLAFVNEAATSLRGDNRRVTGYAPLWLIAFGVGAAFITELCRGVAQFYLREFGADTAFSESELLLPITAVRLICLGAAAAGIIAYALGYFARRPAIRVVEP